MDDEERKKNHAAYMRARRKQISNNRQELLTVLGALGEKTLDILDKMVQASVSNPLLGITSALVIGDILYRAKVIDLQTWTMIGVSTGVLEGAAVANTVLEDVAGFWKLFQSQSQSSDPITPSATTVVFGNKNGDLDALMNRENVKS